MADNDVDKLQRKLIIFIPQEKTSTPPKIVLI